MVKEGHPFGMIKVLLAERCDAKDKYMKQLFKSIRYSDSIPDYKARMKPKNYKKDQITKVTSWGRPVLGANFIKLLKETLKIYI